MQYLLNRRTLMQQALGLVGFTFTSQLPLGEMRTLRAAEGSSRPSTLVLLQLTGGNDGLSTIVPWADDAYANARKATRFTGEEVLQIDDYHGFHPELSFLRDEYAEGKLAIVQGVGYPNPNRSHFKSMDIWHSASSDGRAVKSGWVGRLSEVLIADGYNPERVVHIGGSLPYSLHSKDSPAVSFVQPENYRWLENEAEMTDLAERIDKQPAGGTLGHLRGMMRDAAASSRRIRAAAADYETTADYPKSELAGSLRTAASLIKSDLGCRVLSLKQNGYDTHQGQRSSHNRQMSDLNSALRAFRTDLADSEAGRRTVIMAFSEFGRRVVENASAGTDHGTAGPVFVLGDGVEGGLVSKHPSLSELDGNDLIFNTDFRSVYATLIEELFAIDSKRVLGAEYPKLPLIA